MENESKQEAGKVISIGRKELSPELCRIPGLASLWKSIILFTAGLKREIQTPCKLLRNFLLLKERNRD